MANDVSITKTEVLSDNKYTLKNYSYQLTANGKTTDKKAEIYHRPDAVAVLLYNNSKQTFILTKQFRLASYLNGNTDGYMIEACAGLIDEGEAPEQTALREVKEELGYELKSVEKAGAVYSSVGGLTEKVYLFTAEFNPEMKTAEGGGLEVEGEAVETLELSINEVREKLNSGDFTDMKTMALLQYYFLNKV